MSRMARMNLIVLALAVIAVPASSRAQQPDTIKKVDTVKVDTVRKESAAEKVGRQTGKSLDKAAKTTERNAKVLGKRTADNTKHGYKQAESDVKKAASRAVKATKTNFKNAKEKIKRDSL